MSIKKVIIPAVGLAGISVFIFWPVSLKNLTSAILNSGSRENNVVALTFDADMTPSMLRNLKAGRASYYDPSIIKILEENSIPATFFITGLWAQAYPDIVKQIAAEDEFEIGNHSYDHAAFTTPCYSLVQAKNKTREVTLTQTILSQLTGKRPTLFRFPGGCANDDDINLVERLGLKVVGWDVVSGDAFSDDEYGIAQNIDSRINNGSIIVMHISGAPNAPKTSAALPRIIQNLKNRGFTFVKVSQIDH